MGEGEWRAQLPQDLKEHEAFQPYATLGDFAKAHLTEWDEHVKTHAEKAKEYEGKIKGLEGKVGEMIPRLPENATDEEREVYWHQLGKPEKMEEYEIPAPEDGEASPEMVAWARKTFHEAHLTKEQAKLIGAKWNELVGGMTKAEIAAVEEQKGKVKEALVKDLGGEEGYNAAIALADRLWKSSTDQDFTTFLKDNSMIKNPHSIIKVIIDLAKKTGEDLSPPGKPGGTPAGKRGMVYDKSPPPQI